MDAYDVESTFDGWKEDSMVMEMDEMVEAEMAEEVDEMLDELVEESDESEDFSERVPRGLIRRRPISTARGGSAYRTPAAAAAAGFVTQKQLQDALGRVGADVRRNAQGIKTVNGRVDGVVKVNKVQSRAIGRLDKAMKIDGVFEFIEAYNGTVAAPTPGSINLYQVLKGAVKSGYIGQGKGALANPLVLGGVGLVLRNPGILGGLIPPTT